MEIFQQMDSCNHDSRACHATDSMCDSKKGFGGLLCSNASKSIVMLS